MNISYIIFKLKVILNGLIASTLTFLAPILPACFATGILIIIDFITALIAARQNGEKINSKKMKMSIVKLAVYNSLIFSAFLCETFLFPIVPFVKISLAFLAMTEFLSISENFEKATGKSLIKYIKTFLDDKLKGIIKKEDEPKEDESK